jgi:hypothetical protein
MLTSARYARDLAEVQALGGAIGSARAEFDTQTAVFWQVDTPAAMWDRVADTLAVQRHQGLVQTARVLALTDIALADATIAVWNAKNHYDRWRPITAITRADTDDNPATTAEPAWTPLLTTPAFQEYPAAHPGVSAAATSVLAAAYGEHTSFTVTSSGAPGVERSFTSFDTAAQQVQDARIFGGIHFRFSTITGAHMGDQIAAYVLDRIMRPVHG